MDRALKNRISKVPWQSGSRLGRPIPPVPNVFASTFKPLLIGLFLALATTTAGEAQVAPGRVSSHQKISDTEGSFSGQLHDLDWFGTSIAKLGDLDGDGVGDVAVGADTDDDGGPHRGAAWVLFLNADGTVKSHQKISDTQGSFTGTLDNADQFGISVASLGDLDGPGGSALALAVGSWRDDDAGTNRGAVWILFLNANGKVLSHQKISDTQGGFAGTLNNNDFFGFSVASLGDLDGDGIVDLAVGSFDDDGGTDRGAVWVLFLHANGTVKSHQKISDTQGGFAGPLDDFDWFGNSVANMGDLDGDDVVELAVGAPRDDDGGFDSGAVWVLFLNDDGTVSSHQKISDTEGNFVGGLAAGDRFGSSVTSLGDLDGDAVADLAVGAPQDDDGGGNNRGAVWELFLNTSGTVKLHQKISDTQGDFTGTLDEDDRFSGRGGLASLGDHDGDGIVDLAVGAWLDDDGGIDRGAFWILFLAEGGTPLDVQAASRPALGSHFVASVPNPFRARTRIHYDLIQPGEATLRIHDIAGRLVRSFDERTRPAGVASVDWDGRDDRGRTVASGTYLVRLVTSDSKDAITVTLIK